MQAKLKLIGLALALLISAVGCGSPSTATIGGEGAKGTYRQSIDKSNDTATKASEAIKSGEKEVYGE